MLNLIIAVWESLIETLYKLCLLATFLLAPVLIGCIVVSLFKPFDPIRILVYCAVLVVVVHVNKSMKGG